MWYRGLLNFPHEREKALSRSHGVAVSSPPSHGGRTGSNPVGTIYFDSSEVIFSQCAKNVLNLQAFSRFYFRYFHRQ